jgi:hypothetical protein
MAGERRSQAVHLHKRVQINMIWLLLSVSHWHIIMIGPGGLLSVVPPPIRCPRLNFIGGVAKRYITKNLDVKNISPGWHLERNWRGS